MRCARCNPAIGQSATGHRWLPGTLNAFGTKPGLLK